MGNSSSQVQAPSPLQQPEHAVNRRTPSTTGSQVLARELEQSAMKSSQIHLRGLSTAIPSPLPLETPVHHSTLRPFKRLRVEESPMSAKPRVSNGDKTDRSMRPPPSGPTQRKTKVSITEVGNPRTAEAGPQQQGRNSSEEEEQAYGDQALRGNIVTDWLGKETPAPPEVVPLIEGNQANGKDLTPSPTKAAQQEKHQNKTGGISKNRDSDTHPAKKRKRNSDVSQGADVPHLQDPPTTHPSAPSKEPAVVISKPTQDGPYSDYELEVLDELFERSRRYLDLTLETMKTSIKNWGDQGPEWDFKVRTRSAFTYRSVRNLRTFCRRRYAPGSPWPLSIEEEAIVSRVFDETCKVMRIAADELRKCLHRWSDDGPAAFFKRRLAEALPKREARVLKDYSRRRYRVGKEAEQQTTANTATVTQGKKRKRDSNNEEGPHVASARTAPAASSSKNPQPHTKAVSEDVQQPTPATSVNSSVQSLDRVVTTDSDGSGRTAEDGAAASKGPTPSQQHLNIFDPGDYYDMFQETNRALQQDFTIANLLYANGNDSNKGDISFWRRVTELNASHSRFRTIKDPELLSQLRRLAYRVACRKFAVSADIREVLDDGRYHIRAKIDLILQWILDNENRNAKKLRRCWRADLVGFSREECALIRFSEMRDCVGKRASQYHDWDSFNNEELRRLQLVWDRVEMARVEAATSPRKRQRDAAIKTEERDAPSSLTDVPAVIPDSQPTTTPGPILTKERVNKLSRPSGKPQTGKKTTAAQEVEIPETAGPSARRSKARSTTAATPTVVEISSGSSDSSQAGPDDSSGQTPVIGDAAAGNRGTSAGLSKKKFLERCKDVGSRKPGR